MAARTQAYSFFGVAPRRQLGDWALSRTTVDAAGRVLSAGRSLDLNVLASRCPGLIPSPGALPDPTKVNECGQRIGLHIQEVYQPGSRFWAFQGIEAAIFVGLAAALIAVTFWLVRRRVT